MPRDLAYGRLSARDSEGLRPEQLRLNLRRAAVQEVACGNRFLGVDVNMALGVFAPTSRLRDKVVPPPASTVDGAAPPAEPQVSTTSPASPSPAASSTSSKSTSVSSTYRLDWAALLLRVFGVDVLKCPRCQGKMRLIACIEEPDVAKKILEHLGLRAAALPTLRAQAPPVTLELFPAA